VRRLARRIRDVATARIGSSALILTYHRVAELGTDPQLLAVRPDNFASQLRVLVERYQPVPLGEIAARPERGSAAPIAVTFDDGYADNLFAARLLLEAAHVPATVFVASGCVASGREFWWDELERIILGELPLPANLDVEVEGARFSTAIERTDAPADPSWNVLLPDTSPRHRLYRELSAFLRPLPAAQREAALEQVRVAFGTTAVTRESHRLLTAEEVAVLDASPAVEIGAHSADHDVLALRTRVTQRDSIARDKAALEAICGRRIESFSYPYGGRDDYSGATVRTVNDFGFRLACANTPGIVKAWTNRFRLPRFVVRDWDGDTLAANIERWLGRRP